MLRRLATLALVGASLLGTLTMGSGSARSETGESFPYEAFVLADEVNVRSGPGDNYYPVLKLNRGQRVEIYRHDPGGWYAIRPPEGSYSWVSGEFIKPTHGNFGEVIGERVVARVGSVFSDVRDVIQVRLDRGEEVEILEAKRFNSGPAAQTWYKIAPPAGEFRWVAGKFVARELQTPLVREKGPRNNLLLARIDPGNDTELRSEAEWSANRDKRPAGNEGDAPQPRSVYAPKRSAERDDREEVSPSRRAPPVTASPPRSGDLNAILDELEIELSTMVVDQPAAWDFRNLSADAEAVLARAETAVERGRARILLSKIERFDDIRQRTLTVATAQADTDRRNRSLASADATRTTPARPLSDDPRYDGIGRLARVESKKVGSPQFALLDSAGSVRYYVSPAPGVNLRSYLGRDVGVSGTLGYLPDQRAQHVTARQITEIDGTKLR
jgi:uncharacterized protein YgiM (DUF1202 family)